MYSIAHESLNAFDAMESLLTAHMLGDWDDVAYVEWFASKEFGWTFADEDLTE